MESSLQPVITAIQLYCGTFIPWLIGVAPTGGHSDWSGGEKWLQRWNTLPCTAEAEGHSSTIYTLILRSEQEEPAWGGRWCLEFTKCHIDQPLLFLWAAALSNRQSRSWVIRIFFAHINWLRRLFTTPMNLHSARPPGVLPASCVLSVGVPYEQKLNPGSCLYISVTLSKPDNIIALRSVFQICMDAFLHLFQPACRSYVTVLLHFFGMLHEPNFLDWHPFPWTLLNHL